MSVDDKTIYVSTRHHNGHVLEKEENAIHKEWVIERKLKFYLQLINGFLLEIEILTSPLTWCYNTIKLNVIIFYGYSVIDPLILESDQHLISPYNITPESHIKVMRIKEMITREGNFWLANKFSLSSPLEMYEEQCGKYAYWWQGVKGQ